MLLVLHALTLCDCLILRPASPRASAIAGTAESRADPSSTWIADKVPDNTGSSQFGLKEMLFKCKYLVNILLMNDLFIHWLIDWSTETIPHAWVSVNVSLLFFSLYVNLSHPAKASLIHPPKGPFSMTTGTILTFLLSAKETQILAKRSWVICCVRQRTMAAAFSTASTKSLHTLPLRLPNAEQ